MVRGLLTVFVLCQLVPSAVYASSISRQCIKIGKVAANVVTVNLTDPQTRVSVAIAKRGVGSCESFKSIVKRTHPSAAITGTFFDTKTLVPTGDIALFGSVVHSGCIGSALCIDANNKASIVPMKEGRKTHWENYETVLCAGPTLIKNGKISINLRREGFHSALCAPTQRTAVGITKSGKLILIATNKKVSLRDVARVMIKLHAVSGVSLDGGSSTAFYSSGKYLSNTSRPLTNCLVAYSNVNSYKAAKCALAPEKMFAKAKRIYEKQNSAAILASLEKENDLKYEHMACVPQQSSNMTVVCESNNMPLYVPNGALFFARMQPDKILIPNKD